MTKEPPIVRSQSPAGSGQLPGDRLTLYRERLRYAAEGKYSKFMLGTLMIVLSPIAGLVSVWLIPPLFALGLTLWIIAQIQGVDVAIRETHLEEADRCPKQDSKPPS